jgi:hypothetical protein
VRKRGGTVASDGAASSDEGEAILELDGCDILSPELLQAFDGRREAYLEALLRVAHLCPALLEALQQAARCGHCASMRAIEAWIAL